MDQLCGVGGAGGLGRDLYVGLAVVSARHKGLAALWVVLTVLLNTLIVPLSVSGLEAVPIWEILGSRPLQVAWGSGLGLLSTLCVCGCLWADLVREGSGLPSSYEAHLLSRISEEESQRGALTEELSALRAEFERRSSVAGVAAAPQGTHAACGVCGYWDVDQRKVAGHIRHCRRKRDASAAQSGALGAQEVRTPEAEEVSGDVASE